ncbi:AsmA family protein [Neoroseomonas soli]|uniref:AsmA family protein n=1 Tax=Neoroseomonas soli TaxID=1081025 RepID=A0A9X9WRF3_9PROT|nr:AsmA family protein [Neoroseomonas soli]MBR0669732.1 AsmA family protein [Neoroseomonas soli]
MRRSIARWTIGIVIAVFVLFAGAAAVAWLAARPMAEARLSAAIGRSVTIGSMSIEPSLGLTTITFDEVRIANPEGWPADPPFARILRVTVDFDLARSVRTRALVLPSLAIESPVVTALSRGEGDNNYSFALPAPPGEPLVQDPTPPSRLRIGALRVQGGQAHVAIDHLRADFEVGFETRDDASGVPMIVAEARGTYAAQPLTASLTGGALLALGDAKVPWPVDLTLANGPTRGRLVGTLQDAIALAGADLTLELAGPDMALLTPLTGVPIPRTPRYQVRGKLSYADTRVRFTEIAGRVGNSDLGGTITIDPRGTRPDVTAELQSRRVDLADLAGFIGGRPGRGTPTRETQQATRVLPDAPVNIPKLEMANVHLAYRAQRVVGGSAPVDDLRAQLELIDGTITLRPVAFGVGRGEVVANLVLTPTEGEALRMQGQVDFRRVDISRIMRFVGSEGGGSLTGRARINATGRSTAELLARGDGSLILVTSGGSLSAVLVDLSGLRLGNAIFSAFGLPSRTRIECFVSDFVLQNGVLRPRVLLLETADALLSGEGSIRLDQERLDMRVRSRPKRLTIAALPTDLLVTGTLKDPMITPEIVELGIRGGIAAALGFASVPLAILPTIELGIGDDTRCNDTLRRAQGGRRGN